MPDYFASAFVFGHDLSEDLAQFVNIENVLLEKLLSSLSVT